MDQNYYGMYTMYNNLKNKHRRICVYCHNHANTKDHVPTKFFLHGNQEQNNITVPACFECNNSFSESEKYVGMYLKELKLQYDDGFKLTPTEEKTFAKELKIKNIILNQIKEKKYDKEKILLVAKKLIQGHFAHDFDLFLFPTSQLSITFWISHIDKVSKEQYMNFLKNTPITLYPEVGSRYLEYTIINNTLYYPWIIIQKGIYEYCISYTESGNARIRIVLYDLLFIEAIAEP